VPIWKRENWADGRTEWVHPEPVRNGERGARSERPE
jgi:molybdopterin synthase catalytic subunit